VHSWPPPTPDSTDATDQEPQTTSEEVNENEVPDDVKESLPAAKELKQKLIDNGYDNASVSLTQQGEIVVSYSSEAGNGPELKDDMGEVAIMYSEVVGNETGGLTVAANGVKLMVSSDAAIAHDDGKLNKEAFEKTYHWSSYGQESDE